MTTRCNGKGFEGCKSCINRELDPFECDTCESESNWQGDENADRDDDVEEMSISEFASRFAGGNW